MEQQKIVLTVDHLKRMNVPKRFWNVSFDKILPEESDHRKVIKKYLITIDERFNRGCGLLLTGNNGTGKTSCAVVVGKEARRKGYLVLFIRSTALRDGIINNKVFDDGNTFLERARNVDLLIIDDLGKEYSKEYGSYNSSIYEDLLRVRVDEVKPTIITSNLDVEQMNKEYKISMMKLLKSYFLPLLVKGYDYLSQIDMADFLKWK